MTKKWATRLKVADLTSGMGALVLGIGVGANFSNLFNGKAVVIITIGAVMHGWGMFDKHRIEEASVGKASKWTAALYWLCWGLLAVLAAYLIARHT
jgi:hypothetical protein